MTSQMTKKEHHEVTRAECTRAACQYRPDVDIVEHADELLVIADLPGTSADDIDIDFENGRLHLHAKVTDPARLERECVLREFGVGDFERSFSVSERIDAAKITAEYADGVLTLHLPKVEAIKPRKISVQT